VTHRSKWREIYKVHPAADVFPMMSDEELAELGEDIKKNGLRVPMLFWFREGEYILLDGRNRLEAMERAGAAVELRQSALPLYRGRMAAKNTSTKDPVVLILALNIRRRHLTKQQQADLILAAHKASRQLGEVPNKRHVKGKAGSEKDEVKTAIVNSAAEHGISKRTVERAMAKAEGREPKPAEADKAPANPKRPRRTSAEIKADIRDDAVQLIELQCKSLSEIMDGAKLTPRQDRLLKEAEDWLRTIRDKPTGAVTGIEAARKDYLEECADPDVDLVAEQETIIDALREIASKRAIPGKRAIH
jgi:hypothetical protein